MATLAESFLADLDDLSDGSDHDEEPQKAQADTEVHLAFLLLDSFCGTLQTCSCADVGRR